MSPCLELILTCFFFFFPHTEEEKEEGRRTLCWPRRGRPCFRRWCDARCYHASGMSTERRRVCFCIPACAFLAFVIGTHPSLPPFPLPSLPPSLPPLLRSALINLWSVKTHAHDAVSLLDALKPLLRSDDWEGLGTTVIMPKLTEVRLPFFPRSLPPPLPPSFPPSLPPSLRFSHSVSFSPLLCRPCKSGTRRQTPSLSITGCTHGSHCWDRNLQDSSRKYDESLLR